MFMHELELFGLACIGSSFAGKGHTFTSWHMDAAQFLLGVPASSTHHLLTMILAD